MSSASLVPGGAGGVKAATQGEGAIEFYMKRTTSNSETPFTLILISPSFVHLRGTKYLEGGVVMDRHPLSQFMSVMTQERGVMRRDSS